MAFKLSCHNFGFKLIIFSILILIKKSKMSNYSNYNYSNIFENNYDRNQVFSNFESNFTSNENTNVDYITKHEIKSNSSQSIDFKYNQLFFKQLSKKMSLFISPILLGLGGIGNPLCIIILIRNKQKNPTIIYLCLLAAFDFLVLYTGLLRLYIKDILEIDVRGNSAVLCKLHTFFTYTFMHISSYILVAVTLNRFTVIFNRSVFCRKKNVNKNNASSLKSVFWITGIMFTIISLMNIHFLFYYELVDNNKKKSVGQENCSINHLEHDQYYQFRTKIFPLLHFYLFIVLPCCILFVLNILIIRKIMVSSKSSMLHALPNKQTKKREKKRTALSIMLVAVCLWFIILKTPASFYFTFQVGEMAKPYYPFTYGFAMLINYTNHAVNLILYIATSSSFREEFKEYFSSIRKKVECKKRKSEKKFNLELDEKKNQNQENQKPCDNNLSNNKSKVNIVVSKQSSRYSNKKIII